MNYCRKCVLPDTRPNIRIQADGVCNACRSHGTRKDMDWQQRRKEFETVVANARRRSSGYDCVIPVSGGKDSHWQVVKCREYGLNPLAVTWQTPGITAIGRQNLENLVQIGVDHIAYRINPLTEKRFMLKALERYGSTAIPMHMAIFNIPLQVAVKFDIPLVVWGENSAFEYGTRDEALTGFRLTDEWLRQYGVTHGTKAEDWVAADLPRKSLTPYFGPSGAELAAKDINAVFLGYYFPWDPAESLRCARAHGFKSRTAGPKTGYYDYADIDDDFISIHHFLKWYKFGFTRTYDNLSLEIRNGRTTRPAALATIKSLGDETPWQDIEKFCAYVSISKQTFFDIIEKFRNTDIWKQVDGTWQIEIFLFEDWDWQ